MDDQQQQPVITQAPTPPSPAPSEPLPPHPAFATVVKAKRPHKLLWTIVAIILIAAAGYGAYYWQHQKVASTQSKLTTADNSNNSLRDQIAQLQQQAKASSSKTGTTSSNYTVAQAVPFVQAAYQAYVNSLNIKSGGTKTAVTAIKSDLAPSLYTALEASNKDHDPVTCTQSIPGGVNASASDSFYTDTSTAVIAVTYKSGSSSVTIPYVTVDLQTLKISAITCADLPNS